MQSASSVLIGGETMTKQDGIVGVLVQASVGLEGDLRELKTFSAIEGNWAVKL